MCGRSSSVVVALALALSAVRATEGTFSRQGFPIEVLEIAHHDHNYYGIADRVNRVVWEFLKDKRLAAEAR